MKEYPIVQQNKKLIFYRGKENPPHNFISDGFLYKTHMKSIGWGAKTKILSESHQLLYICLN